MASGSAHVSSQEQDTEDIPMMLMDTIAKSLPETRSSKSKKRRNSDMEEPPAKKRKGATKKGEDASATITGTTKAVPAKLGRPRRTQPLRHDIQTYPAGRAVKGDTDECVSESPENQAPEQPATAKSQTDKQAAGRKGAKAPGKKVRTLRSNVQTSVSGEGHASAILNGRIEMIKARMNRGREKSGQGKSSGKLAATSPAAQDRRTSRRLANRDSKRAAGRPAKRGVSQGNGGPDEGQDSGADEDGDEDGDEYGDEDEDGDEDGAEGEDEEEGKSEKAAMSKHAAASGTEPRFDQGERQGTSEGNNSSRENSLHTDSDDENGPRILDLLGEENRWDKVFKAAQEVGGKKVRKNQTPKVQTETIKSLMIRIKEARSLYERLSYEEVDQEPPDRTRERLHDCVYAIEEQVNHKDISEEAVSTKRSEMVRDIYARAIPALVYLLDASFTFHGLHPQGLRRFEALREIVEIQEIILLLCAKAVSWKAKPNTVEPIIKPTKSVIRPFIRHMKAVFEIELAKQKRKWKIKYNALKTANREKEGVVQSQRQRENSASEKDHRSNRILDDIQRQQEILRGSKNQNSKSAVQSAPKSDHHHSKATWTEAEEIELITQLKVGYKSGRTPEDRYLAILNARLLQNKLPEHIRKQALALKPWMLEVYGAQNPPVSLDWIQSIV